MVDCNLRRLKLGEEKKKEEDRYHGKNIMACHIP